MINFRFHLVSLIAVFLALALGVLMGATVIDQAIVDGLRNRIGNVRDEASAQRAENSQLRDELERLQRFVGDEYGVAGRLESVPVAVIAPRGVEGDEARGTVDMLQIAGALAPGVLWLEEKWQLSEDESRQELADILGVPRDGAGDLRSAALAAIGARLAAGAAPAPPATDLLEVLEDAEFVTFEPVGEQGDTFDLAAYPVANARALLLDQSDAPPEANEVVDAAIAELVATGIPLAVGEVYQEEDDGPARGARLAAVREDDELRQIVSTVDDLEEIEGKVATVFVLADLPGTVGHYGRADDVDGLLPAGSSQ